jgi:hypothetical protein
MRCCAPYLRQQPSRVIAAGVVKNCRLVHCDDTPAALPGLNFQGAVAALSRMQGFKSALDVVHALRLAVSAVVAMAAAASPPLQVAGDEMLELFALAVAKAKPSNACSLAAYLDMFHIVDGSCGAEYSDYVYAVTLFRSAVMVIATASDEQGSEERSVAFSAPSSGSASNRPAQSLEDMAKGWTTGNARQL